MKSKPKYKIGETVYVRLISLQGAAGSWWRFHDISNIYKAEINDIVYDKGILQDKGYYYNIKLKENKDIDYVKGVYAFEIAKNPKKFIDEINKDINKQLKKIKNKRKKLDRIYNNYLIDRCN